MTTKKINMLLILLTPLFFITSCGNKQSSQYQKIIEKTQKVKISYFGNETVEFWLDSLQIKEFKNTATINIELSNQKEFKPSVQLDLYENDSIIGVLTFSNNKQIPYVNFSSSNTKSGFQLPYNLGQFMENLSFEANERNLMLSIYPHFESSERLLKWFNNFDTNDKTIDSIAKCPGNEIMEQNIFQSTLGTEKSVSFNNHLKLFAKNPQSHKDPYYIRQAYTQRDKTKKLLERIKNKNIKALCAQRALEYFPNNSNIRAIANIYFVLTGWEWGDAYVRKVKKVNNKYVFDKNGDPVIVINLTLFSKLYGETADEQFQVLTDILSHELFHLVFEEYKKQSNNYPNIPEYDYVSKLFELVQNEGIAHYVDMKENLLSDFSKYEKYQKESFEELNKATATLRWDNLTVEEKDSILTKANTGKYWNKYGAITGMFMAYHIERLKGKAVLKKTIENGVNDFIYTYINLQRMEPELPKLNLNNQQ